MPLSANEIIKLISDVSEEENIRVAVTESVKGGVVAACATAIGGLVMGPIGFVAGGTVGGVTSYFMCNKFESVPAVINKMDPIKREILILRIRTFLQSHGIQGAACLSKVMSNPFLKLLLLQVVGMALMAIGKYVINKLISGKEREKQHELCTQI